MPKPTESKQSTNCQTKVCLSIEHFLHTMFKTATKVVRQRVLRDTSQRYCRSSHNWFDTQDLLFQPVGPVGGGLGLIIGTVNTNNTSSYFLGKVRLQLNDKLWRYSQSDTRIQSSAGCDERRGPWTIHTSWPNCLYAGTMAATLDQKGLQQNWDTGWSDYRILTVGHLPYPSPRKTLHSNTECNSTCIADQIADYNGLHCKETRRGWGGSVGCVNDDNENKGPEGKIRRKITERRVKNRDKTEHNEWLFNFPHGLSPKRQNLTRRALIDGRHRAHTCVIKSFFAYNTLGSWQTSQQHTVSRSVDDKQ